MMFRVISKEAQDALKKYSEDSTRTMREAYEQWKSDLDAESAAHTETFEEWNARVYRSFISGLPACDDEEQGQ